MTTRAIWARRIVGTVIAGVMIAAPLVASTAPTAAVQKPAVQVGSVTNAGSTFSQTTVGVKPNTSSGTTLQHGVRPAVTANNAVEFYKKLMQLHNGKTAFGSGSNSGIVHVTR